MTVADSGHQPSVGARDLSAIRKRLAEAFVEPKAIDFKGIMAVVAGRDPITLLMAETRKIDHAGLLDRVEGMGWRLLTAHRLRDAYRADITRLLAELESRDQRIKELERGLVAARGCMSICPDHGEMGDGDTSPLLKSIDALLL